MALEYAIEHKYLILTEMRLKLPVTGESCASVWAGAQYTKQAYVLFV